MPTTEQLLTPLRHCTDRARFLGTLQEAARAAIDVVAPQRSLSANEKDGTVTVAAHPGFNHCRLTRGAERQVAERLGIPVAYADRLRADHPDLWAHNVSTLAQRDARTALYRMWQAEEGWVMRAVLSDRYETYDNWSILQALSGGLAAAGTELAAMEVEADLTPDRFRMRLACPSVELAVPELLEGYRYPFDARRTDTTHAPPPQGYTPPVLWAGLEISNSETGNGAFQIVPRAVVLICRNGLTRTTDAIRAVHLGGRLEQGLVQWSEETRRLNQELLTSKVVDAVRQFVSVDYLRRIVDDLRAAKGIEVARPSEAVSRVQVAAGLSEAETQAVMDAFLRGGDTTLFGLGQAVTAAAQTVESSDRQVEMEAAFWNIVGNAQLAAA